MRMKLKAKDIVVNGYVTSVAAVLGVELMSGLLL